MKRVFLQCGMALLFLWRPGWGLDESKELPFGSMNLYHYSPEEVLKLDSLCFNYFAQYQPMADSQIDMLNQDGILAVRGGLFSSLDTAEAPMMYSWTNYMAIGVDDPYPNPEIRMEKFGGSFTGGMWVAPLGDSCELAGVSTIQSRFTGYPKNWVLFFDKYFFNFRFNEDPNDLKIHYKIDFKAGIDNPDPLSDSIVAYVYVLASAWDACFSDTIHTDIIRLSDFGSNPGLQWITDASYFTIPDTIFAADTVHCEKDTLTSCKIENGNVVCPRYAVPLSLAIKTTGVREVRIDSLRIYDPPGMDLMTGIHDEDIYDKFQEFQSQGDGIYGWDFMDEPWYTNILPFRCIDSLMQLSCPACGWRALTVTSKAGEGRLFKIKGATE